MNCFPTETIQMTLLYNTNEPIDKHNLEMMEINDEGARTYQAGPKGQTCTGLFQQSREWQTHATPPSGTSNGAPALRLWDGTGTRVAIAIAKPIPLQQKTP